MNNELTQRVAKLHEMLSELHALVWGECPSLLNEDSGGDGMLDVAIRNALAAQAPLIERIAELERQNGELRKRLRLILQAPQDTISNGKAVAEMVKQAKAALASSQGQQK